MKTFFKIFTPLILILIIIIISYNTYQETKRHNSNPITLIPKNSSIIFKCNEPTNLHKKLNKTDIWSKLKSIEIIKIIDNNILETSSFLKKKEEIFHDAPLYISIHKVGIHKNDILYSINFTHKDNTKNLINLLFGEDITEYSYDNQSIYKFNYKNQNLFATTNTDVLCFSQSKILIENVIKQSRKKENLLNDNNFHTSFKTISKSAEINLFLNYNSLLNSINMYTNRKRDKIHISEWSASDIRIKHNIILSSGFSKIENTVNNFTDILLGQIPQEINISKIIPENTNILLSMGVKNPKKIFERKNKLLQKENKLWSWEKKIKNISDSNHVNYNEIIKTLEGEAGMFYTPTAYTNNEVFCFFKSKNSINTSSLIQKLVTNKNSYNGYTISYCSDTEITGNIFGEIFSKNTPYFTIIDDYFIFTKNISSLEYLIQNYRAKNVLAEDISYKNYSNYLFNKSNILLYLRPVKNLKTLQSMLEKKYQDYLLFNEDSISQLTGLSLQISTRKDLLLNNISIYHDQEFKEDIKEEWFTQLDTTIRMNPQFVKNHFTKDKMILVQTHSNILYALNTEGDIVWKKMIDSEIIGNINSIDVYKNNKYQAIFNTKDQLHIIDRNGNYVDNFPKNLDKETQKSHSLFDYNKEKKYRIMIVGDDNIIYNYDRKGKKVYGWKYKKTNHKITNKIRHFQIQGKDYILEENKSAYSKLLARNGTERVTFEDTTTFTSSEIEIDNKGTLYAITTENKLWRGNIYGNASTISIENMKSNSLISVNQTDTSQNITFSYLENIFILDKDLNQKKNISLEEEIININHIENLLVAQTNNKIYLFMNESLLPGFPIKTDGFINISDIDNNGKLNIINSKDGALYNYELME